MAVRSYKTGEGPSHDATIQSIVRSAGGGLAERTNTVVGESHAPRSELAPVPVDAQVHVGLVLSHLS